jgi:hypothetical protein
LEPPGVDDPPGVDEPPGVIELPGVLPPNTSSKILSLGVDDPPGVDEPPGNDPPGEDPPGEDPPGEDPPGENPSSGDDPPGEEDVSSGDDPNTSSATLSPGVLEPPGEGDGLGLGDGEGNGDGDGDGDGFPISSSVGSESGEGDGLGLGLGDGDGSSTGEPIGAVTGARFPSSGERSTRDVRSFISLVVSLSPACWSVVSLFVSISTPGSVFGFVFEPRVASVSVSVSFANVRIGTRRPSIRTKKSALPASTAWNCAPGGRTASASPTFTSLAGFVSAVFSPWRSRSS